MSTGATSILYSSDGYEVAVSGGSANSANNRAVPVAGSDGSNNRLITLDTSGRQIVVGAGAAGAAIVGNPLRIGGSDGANTRDVLLDSSGRIISVGAAANGAAVAGNPVLVAGSDGTNARSLRTAADGTLRIDPTGTTTQPISGSVTVASGSIVVTQPTAANLNATVVQGTSPWVGNITQFGGVNISTGTGASGTGIPRVTVANDSNILATQSGTWTVQQGTPPWSQNLTQINGSTVSTAATGVQKVGIVGGAGTSLETTAGVIDHNLKNVGNAAVTVLAAGEQKVATEGLAASGAAASGNPVLVGGKDDSGNARTVRTDPAGDVRVVVGNVPSNATYGNPFGQSLSTNPSGKLFPLRATVYTEQTTNAQRSVKSSSTLDTNAAGTGARQIVITYLDQTGAGPFTETINLNGTTAVNTVSTTICFIEEIHVISVGSTGSNQGTISLFTTTGGGGSAFASIGVGTVASNGTVGDNQTIWAHHYTPTGKTSTIVATAFGTNGNQTGNGLVRSVNPTVATSPELQITGTIVLDASSPTITRTYQIPVPVIGPARTTFYGVSNGTNTNFYGVFEYWDI